MRYEQEQTSKKRQITQVLLHRNVYSSIHAPHPYHSDDRSSACGDIGAHDDGNAVG